MGVADPVPLTREVEQDLSDQQADQFGVGQPLRTASPPSALRDEVIVNEDVRCGEKGVDVSSHEPTTTLFPISIRPHASRPDLGLSHLDRRQIAGQDPGGLGPQCRVAGRGACSASASAR
ncbi:hypothetical protein GCM10010112_13290 [Actinoplanes lobatus]|uniref:Uncharacterized protein n=1 Tax=Actinoplanes lobatus TaxID=113568 RepID=A0ABQ4AR14_9ACTN|nr:hypothetical protein GCM10010112_13290 [Actinoplanes lobatus]GIE42974.1 hypothetical protein Alo02nite_58720 [Actinoplanes lobatus]